MNDPVAPFPTERLGRVADVIDPQPDHRAPALSQDAGFAYVGIRDIRSDGSIDFENARRVDEAAVAKQERSFTIEDGDIAFCRVATLGVPRLVRPEERFALSATMALIKPRSIDGKFLFYALDSLTIRQHIGLVSTGSTRQAIGIQELRRFPIPSPPSAIQRGIADYLDHETARIDALITAKRRMVELLEERWRGLRESMMVTDSVPMAKLGRFVVSIGQGISPEAEARSVDADEWGVLKLSAVREGRFIPSEHKALPADFVPVPAMVPRKGDLLISRANTPALVGDACAVTAPAARLMLCDLIYCLRLAPDLDPEYAAQALLTNAARGQLSSAARGTSQSMVKLRGEDVKATVIPVPTIERQRSTLNALSHARSRLDLMTDALELSIKLLRERREALITAAVTGHLDIPEAA
jgi:type I restriction enzyme S subunit